MPNRFVAQTHRPQGQPLTLQQAENVDIAARDKGIDIHRFMVEIERQIGLAERLVWPECLGAKWTPSGPQNFRSLPAWRGLDGPRAVTFSLHRRTKATQGESRG